MTASRIEQLAEGVTLAPGDCRTALPGFESNSFDACVTDPPYGLGFMGKGWDHGVPDAAHWRAIFRAMKPGAHLLSFGGTRTFGRLWIVIEEAGFEIRDTIMWVYGSGFPKSLDVSKAIDKAAGVEREVVALGCASDGYLRTSRAMMPGGNGQRESIAKITAPATESAAQWQGYGTALKPAVEPIILARKPLSESTVAENVLRWGCGALNIDGCRVATDDTLHKPGPNGSLGGVNDGWNRPWKDDPEQRAARGDRALAAIDKAEKLGRWPANLIHDGSEEVLAAFPDVTSGGGVKNKGSEWYAGGAWKPQDTISTGGDSGSAARFFYSAKADQDDRLGSRHPTIKPVDLKQHLCRLVGRKGALILDPFAGTGTTGEAAFREGMRAVLIEREEEYCADIRRRMALLLSGPEERKREGIKARHADKPADHGPLFA